MLVVNFFGGPGSGKTDMRSMVFVALRRSGIGLHVEEAVERAREELLDTKQPFSNRILLLGEQWRRTLIWEGVADIVVTDSPLLQQAAYAQRDGWPAAYTELCRWLHRREASLNVLVIRDPAIGYDQRGRAENITGAADIDVKAREILDAEGGPDLLVHSDAAGVQSVVTTALERISKNLEIFRQTT